MPHGAPLSFPKQADGLCLCARSCSSRSSDLQMKYGLATTEPSVLLPPRSFHGLRRCAEDSRNPRLEIGLSSSFSAVPASYLCITPPNPPDTRWALPFPPTGPTCRLNPASLWWTSTLGLPPRRLVLFPTLHYPSATIICPVIPPPFTAFLQRTPRRVSHLRRV